MMRVVITGVMGFVGRNLTEYLVARGVEVWGVEVAALQGSAVGCSEHTVSRMYGWGELGEIPWQEVDAVVHLAGKAHDTANTSDEQSYFEVNEGLTKRVLEAVGRCGVRFVLFSSVKAVADSVDGVLEEGVEAEPRTAYGRSKLAAERAVFGGAGKGVVPYILRPAMIHGPGNRGNLNLLYRVVERGVPWPLGAFENKRSFASIGNVCAVVYEMISGGVEGGVYQVADDEAISTNRLIELMAESMGRRGRIWRMPVWMMRWVARVGGVLHLPLNSERLKKLTESYVVSNRKLKGGLGWEVMPVGAEEGMRETLRSFR